jgi:CDP-4-dehydro-6-deoxyglucose reductase, E1
MAKKYLLAENTIDGADLSALTEWLQTNPWLTQGPLVREFETAWAAWEGTKLACFVNSGSSANLLMYAALDASGRLPNRKVVVPAVSWATTVAPAIQLGFEPIVCEADPTTFGLDPNHLESLLKKHAAAAVILVHVLGVPCDMAAIMALKERHGFLLMEDACAATGSRYDGKHVGTFGELSSFSFFFGHHLSTIEGGMICTNDDKLHDLLLLLRSHGWAKDLAPQREAALVREHHPLEFNRPFTFYVPGFNVRSTDLNARIGLEQLKKADRVVARRVENHKVYQARIRKGPGMLCQDNSRAEISSISFGALAASSEHRDRIGVALRSKGIETRPLGGGNMSRQPFWTARYTTTELSMADRIHATSFQLPNHPGLSVGDVDFICDTVLSVLP